MMSSRLYLFTKLRTKNRLFINATSGIISCGCQNIQNKYLQGVDQNKILFSTITPTAPTDSTTPKKRKTVPIPKVTLIQGDEVLITSMENAQKLSKRRNLKLVKMVDVDTKTDRPVYKLMTAQEYNTEDLKQREQKKKDKQNKVIKGEKLLLISQNISEHDLQNQINKIVKWISRSYEVKVVVHGDTSMSKAESIYGNIERSIGELGRILQKRQKETDIKFQVLPPKKLHQPQQQQLQSECENSDDQNDDDSRKPKSD